MASKELSSFDRIGMAARGEEPDRVPMGWLGHFEQGIALPNVKVFEVVTDKSGRRLFQGIKAVFDRYNPDAITVFTYTIVEAVAMGTKPKYYPDIPPGPFEYVVKEPRDLDLLKIPDPRFDGDLPCIYNAIRQVVKEYGGRVPIASNTTGPCAVAARIRGLWEFCYDIMKRPWFAHDLMEHATQACINIISHYIPLGLTGIGWGAGSETTISADQFRKFVLPYDRRYVRAARKMGVYSFTRHVCSGPSAPYVVDAYTDIARDGAYTIWGLFESPEVMAKKKEQFPKPIVTGGGPNTSLVQLGKPAEVVNEVKRWIKTVAPGGRYLFIGDCGIPPAATLENVDAYVKTAKEAGKYPIKI